MDKKSCQSKIKCAVSEEYASCWVHQDCHVADEQKTALKKAAGVSGGKDECQVRLKGRERDYRMGTEIGILGGYGFQGQVTAGDGSDKKGKMGATARIGSVFSGVSSHADRGAGAAFV